MVFQVNLETDGLLVVYYCMVFVLEIFFKESGSFASKITTKLIKSGDSFLNSIKILIEKFFYFISFRHFFSLFLFLSNQPICTQNSLRCLREVQISKQPIT